MSRCRGNRKTHWNQLNQFSHCAIGKGDGELFEGDQYALGGESSCEGMAECSICRLQQNCLRISVQTDWHE
jgi:hypothetical protein